MWEWIYRRCIKRFVIDHFVSLVRDDLSINNIQDSNGNKINEMIIIWAFFSQIWSFLTQELCVLFIFSGNRKYRCYYPCHDMVRDVKVFDKNDAFIRRQESLRSTNKQSRNSWQIQVREIRKLCKLVSYEKGKCTSISIVDNINWV